MPNRIPSYDPKQSAADAQLPPGRYRHYKGKEYRVIGVARHSETEELLVAYQCLYGDFSLWVRPLSLFLESVSIGGESIPRFVYLGDAEPEL